MSAVAIIRRPDGIFVAADAAAYDDDGRLVSIRSKIETYTDIGCIITSRGSALATKYIEDALFWPQATLDFDGLVEAMPSLAQGAKAYVGHMGGQNAQTFTVYLCGWSETRGVWESYLIRSYATGQAGQVSETAVDAPALTLVPLPDVYLAPEPLPHAAETLGLSLPPPDTSTWSDSDAVDYTVLAVCASRLCLGGQTAGKSHCCVGGFLEVAHIARGRITSEIVHRWSDKIGEMMNPRGSAPSPWHQWPGETLAPAD